MELYRILTEFAFQNLTLIIVLGMVISWIGVFLIKQALFNRFKQRDGRGRSIPLTLAGKTHVANLPIGLNALARVGTHAEVQETFTVKSLKPTLGLRLISIGGTAMIFGFAVIEPEIFVGLTPLMVGLGAAFVLYALIFTNTYVLRYDHEGFIVPTWSFQKKGIRWRDLASIRDDGHYFYIVRSYQGEKLKVQKYLVGIEPFLTYANDQILLHDRSECPNSPKLKPYDADLNRPWRDVSSGGLM